jgi:hypothetical protein
MFRIQLPRLYELRDLIADRTSPDAYFHDFETLLQDDLARAVFIRWEEKLQLLDAHAWKALKDEASQYLIRRDPRRSHQQLFDILGQADGYQHLRNIGCSTVRFIPRSDKEGLRTPDLEGFIDSQRILCEVKTINISDDEIRARCEHTARVIESQLDEGFFRKLRFDVTEASDQTHRHDAAGNGRHLVYVNICFDDWAHYFTHAYLRQIEQYLKDNPVPEVEVVSTGSR